MTDFTLPTTGPLATINRSPARLSPIDAVCQAAIDRLKIELPGGIVIDHFPDKPEQFDFEGYDAAALVLYGGSRFSGEGMLGAAGIDEAMRLVVSLLVRSLRGPSGAYELIHAVRVALQGASLAGSKALFPVEADLESQNENVFQYRIVFESGLIAVPTPLKQPRAGFQRASERSLP